MSWTIHIPATPVADFAVVLEAAVPLGQALTDSGVLEQVRNAKAAALELSRTLSGQCPKIAATLNGHALQADQDPRQWYDGVSVSVSGSTA